MPDSDSDSVRHVLRGQLPVDQPELGLDGFVGDAFCAGYVSDSQAVREVAEYFDLGGRERLEPRASATIREVAGEVSFHDGDST